MENERTQYPEIGKRLEELRLSYGEKNQSSWATKHDFGQTRYNNWEAGIRRIPLEAAELLSDRYGVTLDWIYRGKEDGLSESALKRLSSQRAINFTT